MDRLTKRNSNGVAYMAVAEGLSKRDQEIEGSKSILEGFYDIMQKLAAYEDTGLDPEDILSNIKTLSNELNKALEKQMSKSPIADDNGGYPEYFERWLECPNCGEPIPEYVEENETECYCLKCGQKLAWEKE